MVSPATHLVQNHQSQFRTCDRVPVKKNEFKIENAWAFMYYQTVNLKTDSKTVYFYVY